MNITSSNHRAVICRPCGHSSGCKSHQPHRRWPSPSHAGMLLLPIMLLAFVFGMPGIADAQPEYPVRMRIELLSIRNRSASPVPVQIKLEYNQPQILQGTLELLLYDALDVVSQDGLLATMRIPDIALSGGDYIFNALLPPMQTSGIQNLAVIGWFQTEGERIPLSSSLKEVNPPLPHDLLMISPSERATLLCSCGGGTVFQAPSKNKQLLDRMLSLENYNPVADRTDPESGDAGRRSSRTPGKNIQYYAVNWSSRDLPEDPLAYCSFDLVLLIDGALGKLSTEQMAALQTWVQAGGSLCVVPDSPIRPQHLQFVQTLLRNSGRGKAESSFALDDEGRLLTISDEHDPLILAHYGLGRTALLPAVDDLSAVLDPAGNGQLVAHLWKVRKDNPVWQGQPWSSTDLVQLLSMQGIAAGRDGRGFYLEGHRGFQGSSNRNQRFYQDEDQVRASYQIDEQLAPVRDPIVTAANDALMPSDVEMVPTWVIGVILVAYVLTIGPVDYLVLGYLRIRKATWVLFPVVTAGFTLLTIGIAHRYMGSTETGGFLEIIDLADDGVPVRRSRIEMLFYGSRTTHESERRQQLVVPVADTLFSIPGPGVPYDPYGLRQTSTAVLNYSGRFPTSYSVAQTVQQWSPQLTRTFELAPADVELPARIDWSDPQLVVSEQGRQRLSVQLQQLDGPGEWQTSAVVLHRGDMFPVRQSQLFADPLASLDFRTRRYQQQMGQSRESMHFRILKATIDTERMDLFRIVSQIAPQGSGLLEDLPMLDPSDHNQYVLIVVQQKNNNYRVFRRLYTIDPSVHLDPPDD